MKKLTSKIFLLLPLLLLLSVNIAEAQKSREALEKERKQNLKKIEETNRILEETRNKKQSTLGQLTTIKKQISAREEIITNLTDEVSLLEAEIAETETVILAMTSDLNHMKEEYAGMIRTAYRYSRGYNQLLFILSSSNLNEFVMRIQYFRQYSKQCNSQLVHIEKVMASLELEKERLQDKIGEKSMLIQDKSLETENLNKTKEEQSEVLTELSKKEKELKKQLEAHKKAQEKLQRMILDMIKEERIRAKKEAAEREKNKPKPAATPTTSTTNKTTGKATVKNPEVTPENAALSGSFEANKGRLPWPVQRGSISQRFGKQPHAVLKGVYVDNLGIDIITLKSEQVRAVFKGKVISVSEVPGMHNVVMIQHGEYFTVYAKLKKVYVTVGQDVTAKEMIGEVYTGHDDVSELQFHVWKNEIRMDPEGWLIRK
jgi:septal ring factor EnvC (AmiA/AmiB activator)